MRGRALTVGGSDSGGGAGVQADLKTFNALSVFGSSAIVALTAQNSVEVSGIMPVPVRFVEKQIEAVLVDIGTDAVKSGMLYSAEIIEAVAHKLKKYDVRNVVVDPVMVAKTGARLLRKNAVETLMTRLLPISLLATPNIPEAEIMADMKITSEEDMRSAARKINEMTGAKVLVKGGHGAGRRSTDVFFSGSGYRNFSGERIKTRNTHGTGDTLSAAITAYLARGRDIGDAVSAGREFLQSAVEHSFPVGRGFGSLDHSWRLNDD